MSKSSIIALCLSIAVVSGVVYSAYGTSEPRDAVTLASGADIPARSPKTVSPFGATPAASTPPSGPERINGILVPPMPSEAVNNATLRGVDSDNDGVRDDVNRFIAESVGQDSDLYKEVVKSQQLLEQAFLSATDSSKKLYVDRLGCDSSEVLKEGDSVTQRYVNTPERAERYRMVFAGIGVPIRHDCVAQ